MEPPQKWGSASPGKCGSHIWRHSYNISKDRERQGKKKKERDTRRGGQRGGRDRQRQTEGQKDRHRKMRGTQATFT